MRDTAENYSWALDVMAVFSHLQNAPTDERVVERYARALMRIVHDAEPSAEVDDEGGHKDKQVPGGISRREWLVQTVLDENTGRFPAPIIFRRAYCRHWIPADGNWVDPDGGA